MMHMKYIVFVIFMLLSTGLNVIFAQKDTVFWFAAPDISSAAGDSPVVLRFQSYDQPAAIQVSLPANGGFTPLTLSLPAGSTDTLDLTTLLALIESPAANTVSGNGLKITSNVPVNVTYEILSTQNREVFALKGSRAIGTNFYTPFQKTHDNAVTTPASYSGIEIVATQNATTVLITPRTAITGHAANVSFSVTLNAGQTYSARDVSVTAATSLAGSIISSNKPVAVTLYDGQLLSGSCADDIGDQLHPVSVAGTDFALLKSPSFTDEVYILGTQNATALDIYGSATSSTLIASGETHSFIMSDSVMHIHSSKPVYVLQVSGSGCQLSAAVVPGLNCKGNNELAFGRADSDSTGILLITRSGYESGFQLNGASGVINAAQFAPVPGTSGQYVAARIFFDLATVPVGSYNRVSNTADIFTMAVISGNNTSGAGFAFTSDFSASPNVHAGSDDSVCANVNYALNGSVGGGAITGSWSGNGYGTFQNGLNSVPNTYIPSPLDTLISPVRLVLSTGGYCPVTRDTLYLKVTPAPIVNAGINQFVCSNNPDIQLSGSVTGGATGGYWTSTGNGVFVPDSAQLNAIYQPSQSDIDSGSVTFTLISTGNQSCAAVTDQMTVTFTPAPVVDAGADSVTVCANNPNVALTGSVTGPTSTGKWTTTGTGFFNPGNSSLTGTYQTTAIDTAAGFVRIFLESTSNGNCSVVYDSIFVLITNAPVINAGANQVVCANDSDIQLSGSVSGGNFGLIWSGGSGTFLPSDTLPGALYYPTASEIASGSIQLTLTSTGNGNCIAVNDQVQFNFTVPPVAAFNADPVCEENTTLFQDLSIPGSGTLSNWNWAFGNGTNSAIQHPQLILPSSGSISAQLIVTNSFGCTDTVTGSAIVYDKPVAGFNYTLSCPNNQPEAVFTDNSTSDDTISYWYYDFGGQGNITAANTVKQFTSGGLYTVTHIVQTEHQCRDTVVQIVPVDELPNAGFYFNSNTEPNVGATFNFIDTSSNAVTYFWEFADGSTSTQENPTHIYYSNGNFNVKLYITNNLGCADSAYHYLFVNSVTDQIYDLIPTVISPNGDGLNDIWKLEFIPLADPSAHVEIFNEWGQQLFTSDGYQIPWDGTYYGENVPDGNYFFVIRMNQGTYAGTYKGVLTILRKRG